jgi:cysteine desulfurase
MELVYFDNSATTKPRKEVVAEVAECMEEYFANPSSSHKLGMEAEKKLNAARSKVARLINGKPQEIVFTSGGSEANNIAILGTVSRGEHIITSKIEHPSVLRTIEHLQKNDHEVTFLNVNSSGIVDLKQLETSIKDNTRLVAIMHVNNEMGSIQPLEEITRIVRSRSKKARIHVDGVQSAGKLKINVKDTDIDIMSISAHKIYGPKGVGALYIKEGLTIRPLAMGGGQERDIRSGTENLPGISGFGVAADLAMEGFECKREQVYQVKEHFIKKLSEIDGVKINSPLDSDHIDNILNVSFSGVRGEVLLHALEDYRIYVSTGSACSSRKASHKNYVLPALGIRDCDVEGAVRFSFSYMNTLKEVDYAIDALKRSLAFLRRIRK